MTGDLMSSFIKRRLDYASSDQALLLDQMPESALPFLYLFYIDEITLAWFATGIVIFIVSELVLSRILYRMGIRRRPY